MKRIALASVPAFLPIFALAQGATLESITRTVGNLVSILTPIVVALALLFFFWGLAKHILNAGDETAKAEGRNIMIWGIIALFVMVSVWGLVQVLNTTFDIEQQGVITPPEVELK